jgi:hypothetical protein
MVGTVGFEPTTPSVSRKCSPPELSARYVVLKAPRRERSEGYCIIPARARQTLVDQQVPADGRAARPGSTRKTERGCAPRPPLVSYRLRFARADVAQLVEHNLAKVGVAGSNPVVRSIDHPPRAGTGRRASPDRPSFIETARSGARGRRRQVARQRPAKPLSPVRIRASPPYEHRRARPHGRALIACTSVRARTSDRAWWSLKSYASCEAPRRRTSTGGASPARGGTDRARAPAHR